MSYQIWLMLLGAVAMVALAVVLALLVRRRRRADPGTALRPVALDVAHRVLVPNGVDGDIEVEYLLLTVHGIVVVDTKHYEGTIFASDRMEEWTVMGRERRFTFPNPQHALYDRVAAIRRLVHDVPVAGHVVFSPLANFSKGRPSEVLLAHEFTGRYKKPDRGTVERVRKSFWPQWERVKQALEPVIRGR